MLFAPPLLPDFRGELTLWRFAESGGTWGRFVVPASVYMLDLQLI